MVNWPQRGDSHPFLLLAQRKLRHMGYNVPENGHLDDPTWNAVTAFAENHDLPTDSQHLGYVWLALWKEGKVA